MMAQRRAAHMISRDLHLGYLLMGLRVVVGWVATWPSPAGLG
ncbi:hypothetical protein ACFXJ8_13040 [Nonomuraea sp. NPDC059194]